VVGPHRKSIHLPHTLAASAEHHVAFDIVVEVDARIE
jgi:hypothetical protein